VSCLDEIEEATPVSYIYSRTAQFLIKGRIVKEVEILEHEQTYSLEVGMQSQHRAQLI
jgi:hypothetical protein